MTTQCLRGEKYCGKCNAQILYNTDRQTVDTHGTRHGYDKGCQCTVCQAYRIIHNEHSRVRNNKRRQANRDRIRKAGGTIYEHRITT